MQNVGTLFTQGEHHVKVEVILPQAEEPPRALREAAIGSS